MIFNYPSLCFALATLVQLSHARAEGNGGVAVSERISRFQPFEPSKQQPINSDVIINRLNEEKRKWRKPFRASRGPLTPEEVSRFGLYLGNRVEDYDPDFLRDHEDLIDELSYHNKQATDSMKRGIASKLLDKDVGFTRDEMDYTVYDRVPPRVLLERIKKFNKLNKVQQAQQLAPWKDKRRAAEKKLIEKKRHDPYFNGFANAPLTLGRSR
ncbi:hypothetical protein FOZ63_001339 [Perkinsus olseni]|uniref:Uncharacterized protein n=1 Tax=Perkinsus olseni TaxID=32597 RepID=A0A7J6TYH5_PEROL|nr:hypothetical protein FOZ63_001339 [Perkinsus olseni]